MKTDKQINIFCICRQLLFLQNTKSCLYNATTNPPNPIQMFFQRREFFEVNYYLSLFFSLSLSLCLSLSISHTHKHINTQTHKQTHTHFSHFHFILLGMFLLASASSSIHFHSSYFSVYPQLALL